MSVYELLIIGNPQDSVLFLLSNGADKCDQNALLLNVGVFSLISSTLFQTLDD